MNADTARRARQEPEYQLKHRVTGAALIAAAAALGIAILLGGPGGDGDNAQTIRFDFGDGGSTATTAAAQNAGDAESAVVTASPAAGVPINSGDSGDSGESAPAQPGWAVQVGAFDEPDGIEETVGKFKSAGFPVNTVAPAQGGKLTRVWLGPYADRQTARDALIRALDFGAPADSFVVAP